MRIPTRRRQQKAWVLVLVVLICAIVVIGWIAYKIFKCINRMPPRRLPDEITEVQKIREDAIADLQAELEAEHPGETVTIQSAEVLFVPVFVPFGTNGGSIVVQRSTNLTDWETLTWLQPGVSFGDTNVFDRAFYRAFDASGQTVTAGTNAGWQLQPIK